MPEKGLSPAHGGKDNVYSSRYLEELPLGSMTFEEEIQANLKNVFEGIRIGLIVIGRNRETNPAVAVKGAEDLGERILALRPLEELIPPEDHSRIPKELFQRYAEWLSAMKMAAEAMPPCSVPLQESMEMLLSEGKKLLDLLEGPVNEEGTPQTSPDMNETYSLAYYRRQPEWQKNAANAPREILMCFHNEFIGFRMRMNLIKTARDEAERRRLLTELQDAIRGLRPLSERIPKEDHGAFDPEVLRRYDELFTRMQQEVLRATEVTDEVHAVVQGTVREAMEIFNNVKAQHLKQQQESASAA